jgi:hopanoid biosynthesis associated protein HpnK
VRRLIVNADDLGFTSGVNRAIVDAHCHGIVTSATLMPNGPAFADAVQLLQAVPQLSVGCHVVLIDGKPLLDPHQVPSLVETDARVDFRKGVMELAIRALAGRLDSEQIEAECAAQIRKLQSAGIAVSHVDTHKHTHLFPTVLSPLLRAAASCGVRAIRNPFGPRRPFKSPQLLARPGLWTRYAETRVLRLLAGTFRNVVDKQDFVTPDGTLGIEATGRLDETLFRAIVENIPEGTWELVCHPGYNDADLQAARTRLRDSRATELRLLTLPGARDILLQAGIELISYRQLIFNSQSTESIALGSTRMGRA